MTLQLDGMAIPTKTRFGGIDVVCERNNINLSPTRAHATVEFRHVCSERVRSGSSIPSRKTCFRMEIKPQTNQQSHDLSITRAIWQHKIEKPTKVGLRNPVI